MNTIPRHLAAQNQSTLRVLLSTIFAVFLTLSSLALLPTVSAHTINTQKEDGFAWQIADDFFGKENYLPDLGCWRAFYELTEQPDHAVMHRYTPEFADKVEQMGESDPITMPKCIYIEAAEEVSTESGKQFYLLLREDREANAKYQKHYKNQDVLFTPSTTIFQPLLYIQGTDKWQFRSTSAFTCQILLFSSSCPSDVQLVKISELGNYAWVYESTSIHQGFVFSHHHILTNFSEIFKDIGCGNAIKIDSEKRPHSEYHINFIEKKNKNIYPIQFTNYLSINPITQYIDGGFTLATSDKEFIPKYEGNSTTFYFNEASKCYDINRNSIYFL